MAFTLKNLKIWTSLNKYNNGAKTNNDLHFLKATVVSDSGSAKYTFNSNEYTSYYRQSSDNFCLQYGVCKTNEKNKATITLAKGFSGAKNYMVFITPVGTTSTSVIGMNVYRETNKKFSVYSSKASTNFCWFAIGKTPS